MEIYFVQIKVVTQYFITIKMETYHETFHFILDDGQAWPSPSEDQQLLIIVNNSQ